MPPGSTAPTPGSGSCNITFPRLMPVLGVTLVLVMLWVFRDFSIIYVLTGGGPLKATQTLSIMTYEQAFGFFKMGYASAIGIVTLVICVIAGRLMIGRARRDRCLRGPADEAQDLSNTHPPLRTTSSSPAPCWSFRSTGCSSRRFRRPTRCAPCRRSSGRTRRSGRSSRDDRARTPDRAVARRTPRSPPSARSTISMVVSILAGYSLSRFRVRGGHSLGLFILTAKMLPATLLVIPLFGIFRMLDLIGSLWSIILAHATLIVPFTTWMLKGYFDTIPRELEQAAMVDGCSPMGAMVRVDPAGRAAGPRRDGALRLRPVLVRLRLCAHLPYQRADQLDRQSRHHHHEGRVRHATGTTSPPRPSSSRCRSSSSTSSSNAIWSAVSPPARRSSRTWPASASRTSRKSYGSAHRPQGLFPRHRGR